MIKTGHGLELLWLLKTSPTCGELISNPKRTVDVKYIMLAGKKRFVIGGAVGGFLLSVIFEVVAINTPGGEKYFQRSISGLSLSFLVTPLFFLLGASVGYIVWYVRKKVSVGTNVQQFPKSNSQREDD